MPRGGPCARDHRAVRAIRARTVEVTEGAVSPIGRAGQSRRGVAGRWAGCGRQCGAARLRHGPSAAGAGCSRAAGRPRVGVEFASQPLGAGPGANLRERSRTGGGRARTGAVGGFRNSSHPSHAIVAIGDAVATAHQCAWGRTRNRRRRGTGAGGVRSLATVAHREIAKLSGRARDTSETATSKAGRAARPTRPATRSEPSACSAHATCSGHTAGPGFSRSTRDATLRHHATGRKGTAGADCAPGADASAGACSAAQTLVPARGERTAAACCSCGGRPGSTLREPTGYAAAAACSQALLLTSLREKEQNRRRDKMHRRVLHGCTDCVRGCKGHSIILQFAMSCRRRKPGRLMNGLAGSSPRKPKTILGTAFRNLRPRRLFRLG